MSRSPRAISSIVDHGMEIGQDGAQARPAGRVVVWKTAGMRPYHASLRYRCLMQIPYLRACGWRSLVLFKDESVRDWSRVAALILVKSCRDNDVALAREADRAGVPVIYDLTDNFFAGAALGAKVERQRDNIRTLSGICRAITVASPAMVGPIRQHLGPDLPVVVVPDPIETEADARAAFSSGTWRGDELGLRRSPRAVTLKRLRHSVRQLLRGNIRAIQHLVPPGSPPARSPDRKRIVWFGVAGSRGRAGLIALADILPELERLNREIPLELLVVSNSRRRFEAEIAEADLPTLYRAWHPFGVFACIASADAVVVPNRANAFSKVKSSNRTVLALSLGVPVVATGSAALAPLAGAIYEANWEESLKEIFLRPAEAQRRVALGNAVIEREFSGPVVAAKRQEILRTVLAENRPPLRRPAAPEAPAPVALRAGRLGATSRA